MEVVVVRVSENRRMGVVGAIEFMGGSGGSEFI